MNILITENNAFERTIDFNQLYWKAYANKANRIIYFCLFPGLAFIIYDISTFNAPGWTVTLGSTERALNLHLGLGVGLTLLYLIYFILYRRRKEKIKFMIKLNHFAPKLYGPSNKKTITIDFNGISIEGDAYREHCAWSLISTFTILKDYLVIYKFESFTAPLFIHKTSMTDFDYDTLLTFLRGSKKEIPENEFPIHD